MPLASRRHFLASALSGAGVLALGAASPAAFALDRPTSFSNQ